MRRIVGHKKIIANILNWTSESTDRHSAAPVSILLELGSAYEKLDVHEKLNRALQRTLNCITLLMLCCKSTSHARVLPVSSCNIEDHQHFSFASILKRVV